MDEITRLSTDYKAFNQLQDLQEITRLTTHYKTFIKLLKESIEEGSIPMSRIDDAVNRILSVKYDLDLFNEPYGNIEYASHVGSEKHRS